MPVDVVGVEFCEEFSVASSKRGCTYRHQNPRYPLLRRLRRRLVRLQLLLYREKGSVYDYEQTCL